MYWNDTLPSFISFTQKIKEQVKSQFPLPCEERLKQNLSVVELKRILRIYLQLISKFFLNLNGRKKELKKNLILY